MDARFWGRCNIQLDARFQGHDCAISKPIRPNVEQGFHEEPSGFLVEIDGFPSKHRKPPCTECRADPLTRGRPHESMQVHSGR